jgi:hypothetical protein
MALKGFRFPVAFDEAFPMGLVLVGEIAPLTEYNSDRNAPQVQKIDMDRDGNGTGLRLWKATVTDPSETNAKRASFQLTFVSAVQPVPVTSEVLPGMRQIELEGVTAMPKLMGQGEFKYVGFDFRATGIKGDTSGRKGAPVQGDKAA